MLREYYISSDLGLCSAIVHAKSRYCLIRAIIKALFTINCSLGEAEIEVSTRNDRRLAVALPNSLAYRRVDDLIFTPHVFKPLQMSNLRGRGGHCYDEFKTLLIGGRNRAYRQGFTLRSLRRFSRARSSGLAKAMGRLDFSGLCGPRNCNRNRTTYNESGSNRIARRCRREPFGRGVSPHHISPFLDTTPTLRRRHLCAA